MADDPPQSPTTSIAKGKQRVSFAPDPAPPLPSSSERAPLLGNHEHDDADGEYDEEAQDQVGNLPFPSRLHRKLKKGLLVGGSKVKKAGKAAWPHSYRSGEDHGENDITTQKALLYSILSLIVLAVVLGGVVLVQSNDNRNHGTGPYPRPPHQSPTHTTEIPPEPTSTVRLPFPTYPFPSGLPRNPAYLAKGKKGGVATENKRCSDMGIKVLKAGGSAVDAAIASTLCIGTMNMFSAGIGGGGFMTVRIPPSSPKVNVSEVWSIDFRETVPAAGNSSMFGQDGMRALIGGLSVGVPGELKGLHEIHQRWGRLPWKDLVMPSAELAKGWKVGKELDRRLKWMGGFMLNSTDWTDVFAPNGTLLQEGDLIRRTNFSRALTTIAEKGAIDGFYSRDSWVAKAIIEKTQREGGILTFDDLEKYEVKIERALEGTYRGKKVYTTGAPTSGPALLHMLNLLERYDLTSKAQASVNVHRLVETMKFGFAARTKIGDPKTADDIKRIAELHTKEYADAIFPRITDATNISHFQDTTHDPLYYRPVFDTPPDHGTTHITVIDQDGMAVSLTSTVNLVFGSQVLDPITGIIMNDELGDFSLPGTPNAFGLYPSPYNYPEAGKRPLSSIAPTIVEYETGDVQLALGGSGGSRIYGSVLQVILNHLDGGMDISKAVEEPRVHNQLFPLETSVESTYKTWGIESLKERGHNVTTFDINMGVAEVQAVAIDMQGGVTAASDSRKNGIAAAY
ncbi:hypothetical protein FRC00_001207 [Tulasnella sp. 408]|nr:hypothetical protein FRC00_001207 [Tulasnella sp. 408]